MARIRTIKPEFPQSESMSRVSRDARLCFILMWGQADDAGRLRGQPRLLASLLFPYDADAPKLIGKWLDELEREGCIRRYSAGGNSYIDIPHWGAHQKIEKKSPSHIPPFDDNSPTHHRPFADASTPDMDQGSGNGKDQGGEGKGEEAAAPPPEVSEAEVAVVEWNALASETGLSEVQRVTPARRSHLSARLRDCGGLEGWRAGLTRIRGSPFLCGRNARGWRCDFDWLLKEANFVKVMEGKYDGTDNGAKDRADILAALGLDAPAERAGPAVDGAENPGGIGSGPRAIAARH